MDRSEGGRSVAFALIADVVLLVAKTVAFALTGSAAMLSEAVHSFADTCNQALLAVGIRRSQQPADPEHPYGYGRARWVWALLSATGVLFIGCGATVVHGVGKLLDPEPLHYLQAAFVVLGIAALVDGASFVRGLLAVHRSAANADMGMLTWLRRGDDPSAVHVVAEDGAALIGVALAAGAIGMTLATGDARWDAVGSVLIGLLMGTSAVFLIDRDRRLLLGPSVEPDQRARLLAVLHRDPFVEEVHDVKATVLGPDALRFKAEVEFDGHAMARDYLGDVDLEDLLDRLDTRAELEAFLVEYADAIVQKLGDEVDRLEEEIREEVPATRHIDLETN